MAPQLNEPSPPPVAPLKQPRAEKTPGPGGFLPGVLQRLSRAVGTRRQLGTSARAARLNAVRALCRTALAQRGQVRGLIAISQVADAYRAMTGEQRDAFFAMLAADFAVDPAALNRIIANWQRVGEDGQATLIGLTEVLDSPRLNLLRQFNTIPNGIKFLVDLRAAVLDRLARHAHLAVLEYDLRHLLSSWFNYGFLDLIRVQWDTPAAFLEKLIANEAVHHIVNWDDLKNRLTVDRCCFAFIHPAMPEDPLIFLEVALVRGIATSIQALLDPRAPDLPPHQADTAVFYSISNAQAGLRGIPLGNLLIKQVVARLRQEFPHLKRFVTLSPLPRLRKAFLEPALSDGRLARFFSEAELARLVRLTRTAAPPAALAAALGPDGLQREEVAALLRRGLLRATRHYLTEERRDGHAACPVAHFHLANGASLAQINWLADISDHGLAQSAGMMASYLYDMKRFERLQTQYLRHGRIALSRAVKGL